MLMLAWARVLRVALVMLTVCAVGLSYCFSKETQQCVWRLCCQMEPAKPVNLPGSILKIVESYHQGINSTSLLMKAP